MVRIAAVVPGCRAPMASKKRFVEVTRVDPRRVTIIQNNYEKGGDFADGGRNAASEGRARERKITPTGQWPCINFFPSSTFDLSRPSFPETTFIPPDTSS